MNGVRSNLSVRGAFIKCTLSPCTYFRWVSRYLPCHICTEYKTCLFIKCIWIAPFVLWCVRLFDPLLVLPQNLGSLILPFFLGLTTTSTKTNEHDFVLHRFQPQPQQQQQAILNYMFGYRPTPTLLRHSATDRIAEYRLWIALFDRPDRPARRASLLSCLVPPQPKFQSLSLNPCFQLQNSI